MSRAPGGREAPARPVRPPGAPRAAIYTRVSTLDQVSGTSLDDQLDRCRAEVANRGWALDERHVYREEGESGAKHSRPALDRMLAEVRGGRVDALVVTKLDRLGRSTALFAPLVAELDELGVALVSLAEHFDTSSVAGRAMRGVLAVFAEMEREVIAERGVGGQRRKAAEGRWPGGEAPYGYRLEGRTRDARCVPDPAEREVLDLAYKALVRDGKTTGETCALLNGLGHLTRRGSPWVHNNLARLLRRESMRGEVWWGKADRPKRLGHHTKLDRWGNPKYGDPILVRLADPPFTARQHEALERALSRRSYGQKRPDKVYPVSGAATPCGGRLGGVYRVERDLRQYRCSNAKWRPGDLPRCGCPKLHADELDARVWAAVTEVLGDPDRLIAAADAYLGEQAGDDGPSDLEAVRGKLAENERARTQRVTAYLRAGVDPAILAAAVAELEREAESLAAYAAQLEAVQASRAAEADRAVTIRRLAVQAAERLPSMGPEQQREVLQLLRVRVTVLDGSATPALAIEGELPGGDDPLGAGGDSPPGEPGGGGPRPRAPPPPRAGPGASAGPAGPGRAASPRRRTPRWAAG
ncbi:hypothetical protein F1C76_13225 [Geodermatophilaceae bacterium NBWT11]|nr:hypothetical protein F1C76_13225 [Geodermatophilaceae bacterium NBWT11]